MNSLQLLPPVRLPVCSGVTLNLKADPQFFAPWHGGARWDPSPARTEPSHFCMEGAPRLGCGAQRPLKGVRARLPGLCVHTCLNQLLTLPHIPCSRGNPHPSSAHQMFAEHLSSLFAEHPAAMFAEHLPSMFAERLPLEDAAPSGHLAPSRTLPLTSGRSPSPLSSPWPGPLPPPRSPGLSSRNILPEAQVIS